MLPKFILKYELRSFWKNGLKFIMGRLLLSSLARVKLSHSGSFVKGHVQTSFYPLGDQRARIWRKSFI